MLAKHTAIFWVVLLVDPLMSLEELPQVDDNNILVTEAKIRNTINTLFRSLKLNNIKSKTRLKEYSIVHNHLISFTKQDYNNLKQIAKLTRVDKKKISNETASFMTTINDLLNEDLDAKKMSYADGHDESVSEYVEQFLTQLSRLKEEYGVDSKKYHIKEDVYQVLKEDEFTATNDTNMFEFGENDALLDESDYWKPPPNTRRIYKGDRTKIKHYPFMASVQIFNKFHCGGSIIQSDLVITASSCLQLAWNNRFFRENPAFLSVRVGSNFYNGGGENIPVLEVYFHPGYNPKTLWHNLCILRLVRKLTFRRKTRRIKKIDFDRLPTPLPLTTDGITILGWGAREANNIVKNPWTNILSVAVLDVYPLRECQEIYSKEYVTQNHFCAGFFSKGGGACNRDVGGPGVVNGKLTGVVSFGSPVCGTPDAPTVFTKLGYYTDWIEEIMEQYVPNIRRSTTLRPTMPIYGLFSEHAQTTFKIPPPPRKPKPIPLHESDILRMLADKDTFKEFLSTMFRGEELAEYEDLLHLNKTTTKDTNVKRERPNDKMPGQVPDPLSGLRITSVTELYPNIVTELGAYDPEVKQSFEEDDEVPVQTKPVPMVTKMPVPEQNDKVDDEGLVEIDKDLEELVKIDQSIDKLIGQDEETLHGTTKGAERKAVKNDKNKEIEKDLVKTIDSVALKEIIRHPSTGEDKLVLDEKVVKIYNEKDLQERISKIDDSILTLLYLSDSENGTNGNDGLDILQEYMNDKDAAETARQGENNNEYEQGLSIEPAGFKDFTYRTENNSTDVLSMLTKEDIEKILLMKSVPNSKQTYYDIEV